MTSEWQGTFFKVLGPDRQSTALNQQRAHPEISSSLAGSRLLLSRHGSLEHPQRLLYISSGFGCNWLWLHTGDLCAVEQNLQTQSAEEKNLQDIANTLVMFRQSQQFFCGSWQTILWYVQGIYFWMLWFENVWIVGRKLDLWFFTLWNFAQGAAHENFCSCNRCAVGFLAHKVSPPDIGLVWMVGTAVCARRTIPEVSLLQYIEVLNSLLPSNISACDSVHRHDWDLWWSYNSIAKGTMWGSQIVHSNFCREF